MNIAYTVHSVSSTKLPMKAKLEDGTEIEAEVDAITYEFCYNDGLNSHTYTVRGNEPEFEVGQVVNATLALEVES